MRKLAVATSVLVVALTAALVPAFAGGSGGASSEEEAPPVVTFTAGPAGPTNVTSASFMFTANASDAKLFCALDTAKFGKCEPPVSYSGLGDGQHTFNVYGVKDGNQGPTTSWTWTIDTIPPNQVSGVHATVDYGKLRLSWTRVGDTNHVVIFRSVGRNKTATQVYAGAGGTYAETKYVNSFEHRYGFISFDKAGNASPSLGVTVGKGALLLRPHDGATVRRAHPPSLRWRAVRKATFYNVQLWRGKHKVLSIWPKGPHVPLNRAWTYNKRTYHLKPGLYAWFVWPAFGRHGTYGKLAGTATFQVR
jgi:hypothetical protein